MARIGLAILSLVFAVAGVYAAFRAYDQKSAPPIVIADASVSQPVTVEVRGAVMASGVYALPAGARVQDALDAAGGLTAAADLSTINLARRLRDGEVLIIAALPTGGETPVTRGTDGGTVSDGSVSTGKVDINTATQAELEALPGIGKVTAQKIIAFREANGPFHSVDDLVQINGISTRMVDTLRDLVTTGP